jgi:hypothetical protein
MRKAVSTRDLAFKSNAFRKLTELSDTFLLYRWNPPRLN